MFYLQARKFVKCFKLHDECKTDQIIKHEVEKNSTSTRVFVNPDYLLNMDDNFSWNWINLTFSNCKSRRIIRVVFSWNHFTKIHFSLFFTFFFKNVFVYNFAGARSWSGSFVAQKTETRTQKIQNNKQINAQFIDKVWFVSLFFVSSTFICAFSVNTKYQPYRDETQLLNEGKNQQRF